MRTLKQILNEMSYKEFEEKVKKNVMSSDSYKNYAKVGLFKLSKEDKLTLKKLKIMNLDIKCSTDDIPDRDIGPFVIACDFRATFCK